MRISRLHLLGFASYAEYLRSDHWAAFKERYRQSGLPRECAVCGKSKVHLHHHTYSRLGREKLTDVTPLCKPHHDLVHEWLRTIRKGVESTYEAVEGLKAGLVLPRRGSRIRFRDGTSINRGDWVTFVFHGYRYTGRVRAKRSESEIIVKVNGHEDFFVDPNTCRRAKPEEIKEWK
jgi:hypothetical protein